MKKTSLLPRLLALLSLAALPAQAALSELNVAEGTIESPDGRFVGRDFKIADGFKLELLYKPTAAEGQWVALDWDKQGRLIVPAYNSDRMARLTIPKVGSNDPVKVEMITSTKVGAAEGVLNAFDSLYLNVNRGQSIRSGLYRITDENKDGTWDQTRVLRVVQGDGSDHGTHTLRLSPDGNWITMMNGNATRPTEFTGSRVPTFWGEDNLVMRLNGGGPGFNRAPEGNVMNYSPDGSKIEIFAMGFRNPVSNAYNKDGELFLYDADHEPDFGGLGYRPTNVVHVISGGDNGWRAGPRWHPFYYLDNFGTIAVVGSGSPTGGVFGTGAKFPARYQDAYFIQDWSFGNMYAVIVNPDGSSYKADVQPFLAGRPFAASGAIVNPADGSLIVQTTGTELYRVTYVGTESTAPTRPDTIYKGLRDIRQNLAKFHGVKNAAAVNAAWPYLSDPDRAIRYTARVAIEWQDVATWRDRALNEREPRKAIAAIAALARASGLDVYHTPSGTQPTRNPALQKQMLASLNRIDLNQLSYQDKLDLMRSYQLVMIRLGAPDADDTQRLIARLDPLFPAANQELNMELAELLCYLQAPSAPAKVLALIKAAPGQPYYGIQEWINPQQRQRQDRGDQTGANLGVSQAFIAKQSDQMQYAQLLRVVTVGWTPELRRQFLEYFATEPRNYRGSTGNIQNARADFVALMPEADRAALQDLITPAVAAAEPVAAPAPGGRGGGGGRGGAATPGVGAPATNLWIPLTRNRPFTDPELTRLTRYDESVEKEMTAQQAASAALVAAVFAVPTNPATIQTRAQALANADLALSLAQQSGFAKLKSDLNINTPERLQNMIGSINNRGGRGFGGVNAPAGGGFGGGPAGAPPGAPGGRGN
jgi:glucose/arabinose dehydrogenase